ncbi:hypothetical protein HAX54_053214, partial [Datura stramonium]|nr:hypothetical protein [Datura stramonium]
RRGRKERERGLVSSKFMEGMGDRRWFRFLEGDERERGDRGGQNWVLTTAPSLLGNEG